MDTPINAKAALLQALVRGHGYGLDLIERVKKQTKGAMKLGHASVYPALRSLERDGLIESYESEPLPERGGRPRRYYKLTALGRRAAVEDRQTAGALFGLLAPGRA